MGKLDEILQEIEQLKESYRQKGFSFERKSVIETTPYTKADLEYAKAKVASEVLDIIKNHLLDNDGWIPVEDGLPEDPPEYVDDEDNLEECIVMIDGAERPTTLRYAGDGTWWEDGTYYPVIAWRPLPEPYQPERSGE